MIGKCAWCGKTLWISNSEPIGLVSHGICPDCAEIVREEMSETLQEEGGP
jgi:hypothetical protein